jgi:ankyrin repeat protein
MRNIIYFILIFLFVSCDGYLPGFNFESFKGTEAYELAIAVKNENVKKIEKIVKDNNNLINYLDPKFGHSLLMLSVANDLEKSVNKLLELGANPNKKSKPAFGINSEVTTAVFIACNKIYKKNCKTDILEILIKKGGRINDKIDVIYLNAKYITRETPLMIATKSNCIELVKKVIELGADINDYNYINGKGPLSNCIIYDNLDILEYLVIERKAKIPNYIFVRPAHNNTPRQEITLIEFLNEQKYPENSKNEDSKKKIINYIGKR